MQSGFEMKQKRRKPKVKTTAERQPVSIKLHPYTVALLKGMQDLNQRTVTNIIEMAVWEAILNPLSALLEPEVPKGLEKLKGSIDVNRTVFEPLDELWISGVSLENFLIKLRKTGDDHFLKIVRTARRNLNG